MNLLEDDEERSNFLSAGRERIDDGRDVDEGQMGRPGREEEHAQIAAVVIDGHAGLGRRIGEQQTGDFHDQIAAVQVGRVLNELQDLLTGERHRVFFQERHVVLSELFVILQRT